MSSVVYNCFYLKFLCALNVINLTHKKFQKSVIAWDICHNILSAEKIYNQKEEILIKFFAAQTLYSKVSS